MKKIYLLILLLTVAVFLTACGRKMAEPDIVPASTPEATATPAPTPAPFSLSAENHTILFQNGCTSYEEVTAFLSCLGKPPEKVPEESVSGLERIGLTDHIAVILDEKEMRIVQLEGDSAHVTSTVTAGIDWNVQYDGNGFIVSASEKTPIGVFIKGNTVFVLSDCYGYVTSGSIIQYDEYTVVDLYDISDLANPQLYSTRGQDGYFCRASMLEDGLCLITNHPAFEGEDHFLPRQYGMNGFTDFAPGQIAVAENGTYRGYTVISYYTADAQQLSQAVCGLQPGVSFLKSGILLYQDIASESPSREYRENETLYRETIFCDCSELYYFVPSGSGFTVTFDTVLGRVLRASVREEESIEILVQMNNRRLGGATEETETGYLLHRFDLDLMPVSAPERLNDLADSYVNSYISSLESAELRVDFLRSDAGRLVVEVFDAASGNPLAEKEFGRDFPVKADDLSGACILSSHVLGIPAADSYCFYQLENGILKNLEKDIYLLDAGTNVRLKPVREKVFLFTTKEIITIQLTDLSVLDSVEF